MNAADYVVGDRVYFSYRPFSGGSGGGTSDDRVETSGKVVAVENGMLFVDEDGTDREYELAESTDRVVIHTDETGYRDDAIGDEVSVKPPTTTYRAGVTAHGNVSVEAADEKEAVEALNAALRSFDTGGLTSLSVEFVECGDGGLWEQDEARERGVER